MKKKVFVLIISILLVICTVFIIGIKKEDNTDPTQQSQAPNGTEGTTELNESEIAEILKNTAVITVYAPEGATVMLDGKEMPYSDAVKCHRVIEELSGKHTVTVTRDGYESFTRELDLDKEKNHEIRVELTALPTIKEDAVKKAKEILPEIVKICDNGSGDLSSFSFYSEEEKNNIQNTVYGIIDELAVDTESYKTGNIQLQNVIYDNSSSAGDTLSQESEVSGRLIKFTAEYSYSWEYRSDSYEDSGVDSATAKGLILLDYINGQWCIRELYLPLRKNFH